MQPTCELARGSLHCVLCRFQRSLGLVPRGRGRRHHGLKVLGLEGRAERTHTQQTACRRQHAVLLCFFNASSARQRVRVVCAAHMKCNALQEHAPGLHHIEG